MRNKKKYAQNFEKNKPNGQMVPDLRRVKREKSLPTGDKVNIKQTDLHLKSPETHKLVMQLPLVAGAWMEAGG